MEVPVSPTNLLVATTGSAGPRDVRFFVEGVNIRATGKRAFWAQQRVAQVRSNDAHTPGLARFSSLPW